MDIVYIVLIEDEDGTNQQVDNVYKSREVAEERVEELNSRLRDMIAFIEEYEVQE